MHDRIRGNRQLCAALWMCLFALAAMAIVLEAGQPASIALVGSLIVALLTLSLGKFEAEEWLARPLAYRVIIGAWFAVTLAGAVLALVPNAASESRFFGVYFGAVSVLAYRAVVARGPRRAVSGVVYSILLWFPMIMFVVTRNDARELSPPPSWTEDATLVIFRIFVLLLPIVAATALVTFMPRQDQEVPGARVVRDNR